MSIQRKIYEQNARLTEAPRDVDVKPNPETKKMIEDGKMKIVKSAPSYLGGKSIFAVLENPKAGREDDKYVMASISDPKRGKIKLFSYHGSHPSANGAMKFADHHGLTESVELEEGRQPFAVVDTANNNEVVATASNEAGAKSIINSADLPPMSIKDKSKLKIVKTRKKQHIGHALAEAKSKDIVKGLTDMDGPFTVVAIKNNKVIKQENTKMRNMLPAIVKMMRKEVGTNVTIGIEDRKGTIRHTFKEDVEQVDELKKSTLMSYKDKAKKSERSGRDAGFEGETPSEREAGVRQVEKRKKGVDRATKKLVARQYEDVEQVDELKSDTLRSYLDKARKDNQTRVTRMADQPSSVPADKGEMRKLRKRRKGSESAASRLDARKHNLEPSLKREETEQVDELDTKTMKSYIHKASGQVRGDLYTGKHSPKTNKRAKGVAKAKTGVAKAKTGFASGLGSRAAEKIKIELDEMNYLGKDKKFGRKFYEKDGQLHVVVNDGRPQNLGSVEVKGNARMIKKLVKEESIDEAVFSKSQLDQIRAQYSKIKSVDPSQPTYAKLTAFLDKLDDAKLKQLSTAKIKFVSGLALNRVTKRKMK